MSIRCHFAVWRLIFLGLLCTCATVATAAMAPWYTWRSQIDNAVHCAQTSPGFGWVRDGGPYRDARCLLPLRQVPL